MSGLETLVGRYCCAERFRLPNWDRQVKLATQLDLLVAEQDMVRNALDRRDDYLEQARGLTDSASAVVAQIRRFTEIYPAGLIEELRRRANEGTPGAIAGLDVWREAAEAPLQTIGRIESVLDQLEELTVSVEESEDYDPYDDAFAHLANGATTSASMTSVQQIAHQAARIPESLAEVERLIACGRSFLAGENMEHLEGIATSDADRQTIRRMHEERAKRSA